MLPMTSSRIPSPPLIPFIPKAAVFPSSPSDGRSPRSSRCCPAPPRGTAEREGSKYEVDREKAREALQKLDQQLESLSQQQDSLPKKRPPSSLPESKLDRDLITGRRIEEMPDIPDSYFAYTMVALLVLTIFNNIVFNTFIKPSVDGEEQASKIERVALIDPSEVQSLPETSTK